MTKKAVLFTGAILLSLLVAWGVYEFHDYGNQTVIVSVSIFFILGIWRCLLSYFPDTQYIKEVFVETSKVLFFGGIFFVLLLIIGTWAHADPYNTISDWARVKRAITGVGVDLLLFLFSCGVSFLAGYLIAATSRHGLST